MRCGGVGAADRGRHDRDRMSVVAMALVGGVNEAVADWLLRDEGRPRQIRVRSLTDPVGRRRPPCRGWPMTAEPTPLVPPPGRPAGRPAHGRTPCS